MSDHNYALSDSELSDRCWVATPDQIARYETFFRFHGDNHRADVCRREGLVNCGDAYLTYLDLAQGYILVKCFGKVEPFFPDGKGAYPYNCVSKDKHPDSIIYSNAFGAWIAEHQLAGSFEPNLGLPCYRTV